MWDSGYFIVNYFSSHSDQCIAKHTRQKYVQEDGNPKNEFQIHFIN